jgi:hypothetical protein
VLGSIYLIELLTYKTTTMKSSQLKSILDAQFNRIVIESFDIKEIRKAIRRLRLQMTEHFKVSQKELSKLVSNAIKELVAEVNVHHELLVMKMA